MKKQLCFEIYLASLDKWNTLFDENIKNHAVSLALLLIYIDFDSIEKY
jgi:hypothetical protein